MVGFVRSYLKNQLYPLVIERLWQALQRGGYHVLLFIRESAQADGYLVYILRYQVDRIVMASTTLSSGLTKDCAEAVVPVVLFNRIAQLGAMGRFSISSITTSHHTGGRMVGELLMRAECTRIAYLAGLENSSTSPERAAGLMEALRTEGRRLFARQSEL